MKLKHGLMAGVLLCGLTAGQALAQTTASRVSEAQILATDLFPAAKVSGRTYTANLETCREIVSKKIELPIKWTLKSAYTNGSNLRYALKIQRPGQSCDLTSPALENEDNCVGEVVNEPVGTGTSFSFGVTHDHIFGFNSADACDDRSENYDLILVLPVPNLLGEAESYESDTLRIRLDTKRPIAPTGVTIVSGESSILVEWNEVSDADGYVIYTSTSPLTSGGIPENLSASRHVVSSGTSSRVTSGVTANSTYYVGVATRSSAGNESLLSEVKTVTTVPTVDFWEDYLNNGGRETGGYCRAFPAQEGGLLALLVGLVLMWQRTREERRENKA